MDGGGVTEVNVIVVFYGYRRIIMNETFGNEIVYIYFLTIPVENSF